MPVVKASSRARGALFASALVSSLVCGPVQAANWVMLQGTEPEKAPAYRAFGFLGIDYQQTRGTPLPAGPWQGQAMALNQIAPKLDTDATLQFSYLRLGLRGRLFDGKLNYWISPLAGDNPVSQNGTPNLKFTDLSATFNLIPHARVRVGQFKYPGSEEGLQPTARRDYILPSAVNAQIVNERPLDNDGLLPNETNFLTGPASGWRDTGVQLFDAFRVGDWEHTYAVMAGTGSGLAIYNGMGSGVPDWTLYWASEWVFGGKGPSRDGLKLTGWFQTGERELRAGSQQTKQRFDRTRYGVGSTFRRGSWRAAGEWIKADGMIFNGTDGVAVPGAVSNNGQLTASYNLLPKNEADGWYLDGGYTLFDRWELRARYDRLNRGTDSSVTERRFDTLTLGVTYRFNQHLRVLADYQFRDFEAPGLAGDTMPNQILDDVDDLFAVRLYLTF
jgi:hypothetical protein